MKISDLLRLSADNLRRRKGRTALTVIGVVVGTFAIIVLISLGIASNANNEAMLQSWGDLTQIQIWNYAYGSVGETPKLDDEMLETIRAQEHVVAATPFYSSNEINASIYAGKNERYEAYFYESYGVDMTALQAMEFQLQSGSWIPDDLNLGKKKIPVLVGANMGYGFQDTRKSWNSGKRQRWAGETDSLGNPVPPFVDVEKDKLTLRLMAYDSNGNEKTQDFELVVMGTFVSDTSKHYFTESGIAMRISDMKMLEQAYQKLSGKKNSSSGSSVIIGGSGGVMREQDNGYQEVYVKVDDVDNVEEVENWLHDIGYEQTNSMTQIRNEMQASVAKSQMILGGTAAVALLVAALNIANTMMMSIYERTKEIGVMKVLGCEVGKIRTLFLVEAGSIGLLGGAIGVALSFAASAVLNNLNAIVAFFGGEGIDLSGLTSVMGGMASMGGDLSIIPPWLVLLGLGFSMLVGVLSGLWPAHRATKISALEAIRHE